MIRSKCIFGNIFLYIFSLIHKKEVVWPDGPTPCYSQSQIVSAYQSFRSVAPLFFLAKVPFLAFSNTKRVWSYRYAYDIQLVTLILNKYGFVGLAPFFFLAKIPFLAFIEYRKGCGHIDMLMTFPW